MTPLYFNSYYKRQDFILSISWITCHLWPHIKQFLCHSYIIENFTSTIISLLLLCKTILKLFKFFSNKNHAFFWEGYDFDKRFLKSYLSLKGQFSESMVIQMISWYLVDSEWSWLGDFSSCYISFIEIWLFGYAYEAY